MSEPIPPGVAAKTEGVWTMRETTTTKDAGLLRQVLVAAGLGAAGVIVYRLSKVMAAAAGLAIGAILAVGAVQYVNGWLDREEAHRAQIRSDWRRHQLHGHIYDLGARHPEPWELPGFTPQSEVGP